MIPDTLYSTLTPLERVRAAVAAVAREDNGELDKLKRTTAKFTYRMTDPAYSESMHGLATITLAIELNMRACAIDLLLASRAKPDRAAVNEAITGLLEDLEALRRIAARLGMDAQEIQKFGPPRHAYVTAVLQVVDVEDAWEVNDANVEELVSGYLKMLPVELFSA